MCVIIVNLLLLKGKSNLSTTIRRGIQSLQDEHDELQCNLRVIQGRRYQDTDATQDLCHILVFHDSVESQTDREKQTLKSTKQEVGAIMIMIMI